MKMIRNLSSILSIILFGAILVGCQPSANTETNDSVIAALDSLMEYSHENGLFNGTIMVARNNEPIYRKAFGYSNLETEEPLIPESSFYLASVSKQFTTMAVMILKERGQLDYDDKLSDFFPEFPSYADKVTIRHMMTHTSGIPDHYGLGAYKAGLTNADVFELLTQQDTLDFEPGERFSYSNGGYVLLSMIVEKVSGQKFSDFMRENIFQPLGMEHTLVYDESDPEVTNRTVGFNYGDLDDYEIYTTGAGGLFSNVDDLLLWIKALKTEKLVSQATLEEAYSETKLNDGEISNYGYGWGIDKKNNTVQHSGGMNGYRTYLKRYLNTDDSYVMLTNNGSAFAMGAINQALNGILSGEDWELPDVPLDAKLSLFLEESSADEAIRMANDLFTQDKEMYAKNEAGLNRLGYRLMGKDELEKAVAVFEFNIGLNPNSSNVYDSYAEALLRKGDTTQAIENYTKSVQLNPNNTGGITALETLGINTDELIPEVKVTEDLLESYVGNYELDPDYVLAISREGTNLFVTPTGENKSGLFPASEVRFYSMVVNAQITFNKNESGEVVSLTLHQNGDTECRKLD